MKRALLLTAAMVIGLSAASFAATQTATYDVYEGWQIISAPLVPLNPDPYSVFAGAPSGIEWMLYREDPNFGGIGFEGDVSSFGGILLGDGFWLNVSTGDPTTQGVISYEGVEDGVPEDGVMTDMWISLPGNIHDAYTEPDPNGDPNYNGGGWHMIGLPFNHTVCVNKKDADGNESYLGDRILFTDGVETKTWSEAIAATWVSDMMSGSDPTLGGGFDIQCDGGGYDTNLQPGKGYWLQTYKDRLAMIILADN